jgi:serine/threonine protein kinase/Leucine-rich repeat (LRR) protein
MPDLSGCPWRDELHQMVLGKVRGSRAQTIAQHVDTCATCLDALRQWIVSDDILEAVQASRAANGDPTKTMYLPIGRIRDALSTWLVTRDDTRADHDVLPSSLADFKTVLSPPQSADEIGRISDFRVLSLLGIGGMGAVFEAEDTQLKRRVALKVLHPAIAAKPGSNERFLREARSAAALKHERIVTIHQVGSQRETPFLVLELLQGETLEDRLVRSGRLSVPEIVRIGREIAEGLAAAHAEGLLHRDIKPTNIWLEGPQPRNWVKTAARDDGDSGLVAPPGESKNPLQAESAAGRVKILDFGLAKLWTADPETSHAGMVIGTPRYMAPEQIAGGAVDPRTDLFSLGCVLYRMATGRAPFGGSDLLSVLRALACEEPLPLRTLNPQVPQALSELVGKLLSKSPDDRPATAQIVVDQLRAIEQGLARDQVSRRASGSDRSSDRGPRRKWGKKWAIGTGVGVAVLVPLLWYYFGPQIVQIATNGGPADSAPLEPTDSRVSPQGIAVPKSGPNTTAAKAVLSAGGTVEIRLQGAAADRSIKTIGDLPAEQFRITSVSLASARPPLEPIFAALTGPGVDSLVSLDLTGLALDGAHLTDVGLAQISRLTALKTLTLKNTGVTDAGLKSLEGLTNLQSLVLEGTGVSDAGLTHLQPLRALTTLDLTNTAVSDAGLKQLQGLTQLESLRLNGSQVTDAGLKLLPAWKKLHALMLEWTRVTDAGLKELQGLPQLDRLWLRGSRVTDAGMVHLGGLTKLRILDLSSLPITDAGLAQLSTLKNLQHLVLDRTRVTDAGLLQLKKLSLMYSLFLGETGVTEAGLTSLKDLKNLRELGLYGLPGVGDTAVPRIVQLHALQHVDLRHTHLSAKGFGVLKSILPNIKIDWSEPNYALARAVLAAGGRVEIRLEENGTARPVDAISELPVESFQVTRVRLTGSRPALQELLTAIVNSRLDALVAIDLSGTEFDDTDVRGLKPLVKLQELNLAETRITDAGVPQLQSLTSLRRLVLDGDAIRGPGLTHLQDLTELTDLRLGCPALTELFLVELGGLKKLERLSLARSHVSDKGAKYLSPLTRLKELDLSDTQFTAAGVAELKQSLPQCRIITTMVARQLAKP